MQRLALPDPRASTKVGLFFCGQVVKSGNFIVMWSVDHQSTRRRPLSFKDGAKGRMPKTLHYEELQWVPTTFLHAQMNFTPLDPATGTMS